MNEGKVEIAQYSISPNTKTTILREDDFSIYNGKSHKVFVSKNPLECYGTTFWVTIYPKESMIVKIELSNANEKYRMNYKTMSDDLIDELRQDNDMFLRGLYGNPDEITVSGIRYEYTWGSVCSYYDNRSAQAGIVINYY